MTDEAMTEAVSAASRNDVEVPMAPPHAFHRNLPAHHCDETDGIPHITKFAHKKARALVELCYSIQLTESLFQDDGNDASENNDDPAPNGDNNQNIAEASMEDGGQSNGEEGLLVGTDEDEGADDDEEEDEEIACLENNPHAFPTKATLASIMKKCSRLSSQMLTWEGFKYGGVQPRELAGMILHLLRLVTCTLQPDKSLQYEVVGYLCESESDSSNSADKAKQTFVSSCSSVEDLHADLHHHAFALPAPAREALLSVISNLLSNKGPLRAASNAALYPEDAQSTDRFLLVLHWQVLLRMLLRTAPYLDEYHTSRVPCDSSTRVATIQKRTVQLIRDARHYFDQGLVPGRNHVLLDTTARQVWNMVRADTLFHSHTHACYRGTIILYLFMPSRCSSEFYEQVMPDWLDAWTNIDRCPEYDFLWLALFCRARKHVVRFDWSKVRRRILTLAQYWCFIPIGGAALLDKAFPQAPHPRSRSCPPKLKALAAASSSYEEGIDFLAKIAKLLVSSLGTGHVSDGENDEMDVDGENSGNGSGPKISEGTQDLLQFFSYVSPYFHPSNLGTWTFTLGAFLHYFCYELVCRVGTAVGLEELKSSHQSVHEALSRAQTPLTTSAALPPHEIVALLHTLLPLCQQGLYSKNGHVGRAAEAAMLYLVQLDPGSAAPAFWDFGMRALDIQAVNLAHQAPAAISALTRLVQPTLRSAPAAILQRIPALMKLTLAGIDSNDQNKTTRTLIFYRNVSSWIPLGANFEKCAEDLKDVASGDNDDDADGVKTIGHNLTAHMVALRQSHEYQAALAALPANSLLQHGQDEEQDMSFLLEVVNAATGDWVLEFLDRIFELLRSAGEREKAGKRSSGVASRHSSADVREAKNFSRVLKECLLQVFAAMDNSVYDLAVRTVQRFVEEESLPAAAKDASILCQAVSSPRGPDGRCPGLDALVPILTDDLARHSTKTVVYRVRCLAGSVRHAGRSVLLHKETINRTLSFCFASDDRGLFKTGCKLLRHLLATLTEPFPYSFDAKPRVYRKIDGSVILGRSAQLRNDPVKWHVPTVDCVEFAYTLVSQYVMERLEGLCAPAEAMQENGPRSVMLNKTDIPEIRRCLRLVRYTIRGGASMLLDEDASEDDYVPHELACLKLLRRASEKTKVGALVCRRKLCSFLVVLSSIVASDTLHPDMINSIPEEDPYRKNLPLISMDRKICKETSDIALLLLTRRGSSFRSQEAMVVWKAQKQVSNDFTLSAQADVIAEALQSAGIYGTKLLHKDGEDGGKMMPRRVLISRVYLFHNAMIRNSSFEIPRRLRRTTRNKTGGREILFQAKSSLPEMIAGLETVLVNSAPRPLDAYEGILDGLHSLTCHSNTQVRASAISVVEYAMTRFGWLIGSRISRLLSALALDDANANGKFGIPSCALLKEKLNQQGKRKRLAEAMKGVCSTLSISRSTKFVLSSHKLRARFAKTICETDSLISLMPTEEMQKMIHYIQCVFSPYRSKSFRLPRTNAADWRTHKGAIERSINLLAERRVIVGDKADLSPGGAVHWRKMLLSCWFLLVTLDNEDAGRPQDSEVVNIWHTALRLVEQEKGQPLQRVALGLLGKLCFLSTSASVQAALGEKLRSELFCKAFGEALVYDHKQDSSIGGGHDAQWSAGVEDFIREASRFIAPSSLFPFQRSSLASGSFKVGHCLLIERILLSLANAKVDKVVEVFLQIAKDMVAAPPNEDQKNQQVTSAELFAGVCKYYIASKRISADVWRANLLPLFDEAVAKMPFALITAYYDAIRFSLQFAAPAEFQPLTEWMVEKIRSSLWQARLNGAAEESAAAGNGSSHGTDGFNTQSKWLFLFSAVLVELDVTEGRSDDVSSNWFASCLVLNQVSDRSDEMNQVGYEQSWDIISRRLLPHLLDALGHPFHSCRDYIARLLFRICYCFRKRNRSTASRAPSRSNSGTALANIEEINEDPGARVLHKLTSLHSDENLSFLDKYNALNTTRRFLSCCIQLGEAKFELTDFVTPVIPTVFESLKSTVEERIAAATEISSEEQALWRGLEADVVKTFRYSISEISMTSHASDRNGEMNRVLDYVEAASRHSTWQVRQASAHFLRIFQGAHKFLFHSEHTQRTMAAVAALLADDRREVCLAAMAALTGVLTGLSANTVGKLVDKYVLVANKSKIKKKKSGDGNVSSEKEAKRARNQQTSVFFLCSAIMAQPYETPPYVPIALSAISKHSYERNAPLSIRDTVKKTCAEYKKTHMSDNWEQHRRAFTEEQIEALEDVVSTPHYYA